MKKLFVLVLLMVSFSLAVSAQAQKDDVITIKVGDVSFDLVKVEAGSFMMGNTFQNGGDSDEYPVHKVTITKDYYIGKFEVTQALWEAVMGSNPSQFKSPDRPVENINWYMCVEFCDELSRLTGKSFSMPTEAEWEYAAKGGQKSTNAKYSGSSSVYKVAWFCENSGKQTQPVGKKQPNELGLYDMSGNVWEICLDKYISKYPEEAQVDPVVNTDASKYYLLRGGSYINSDWCCRISNKAYSRGYCHDCYGLRVVMH